LDKYKNKQRPEQKQQQYRGAREEKQTKGNKGGRGVEGEGAQRGTHVAAAGQFPKRAAGISHSNNNIRTSLFCLLVTDNCNQIYTVKNRYPIIQNPIFLKTPES